MKIGITMFATERGLPPAELGRAVEERGFDSLFLPEHSHIPVARRTVWPGSRPGKDDPLPDYYTRMYDQIVALSMIGTVTERLILGTAVTLVPQHDPVWLAKQVATLDHLTGGRFMLGVGFGWNVEQGETHGVRFGTRRDRTEEYVATMRTLWRDEISEFHGEHFNLEPSWSFPKPAQKNGPPVLIGGMGPRTYDAIGRYGDGWIPITGRPSITDRLAPIQQAFERYGRDPRDIQVVIAGATTDPEGLANLRAEGVQHALLTVWSEDRQEILSTLDEFSRIKALLD